jgi:uncharacterized protein (TIGR02453 family)
MGFEGWPPQAFAWFQGLERDNSKAYFQGTRAVYEEHVRGPLLALLAELAEEFGEAHVFRPYRDVRFSADRSPYKTQASAVLGHRGGAGPVYYVEVSMDGLLAASGYYVLSRDQLARYRRAVDEERSGRALERVVADLERAGYRVWGEALKTAPRGFPRDHPRARLLRHKGVTATADLPPGPEVSSRHALDHVRATWHAAAPLNVWLDAHVGPPEEAPDARPR